MFLIEYDQGCFVNGEQIDFIDLNEGKVQFTLCSDSEFYFHVDNDFVDSFLNHLQAKNENINNIQSRHKALNDCEDKK